MAVWELSGPLQVSSLPSARRSPSRRYRVQASGCHRVSPGHDVGSVGIADELEICLLAHDPMMAGKPMRRQPAETVPGLGRYPRRQRKAQ